MFTSENVSKMQVISQDIQGEVAFVSWSMGNVIFFENDTFIVRNGKIAVQTFGMYMPQAYAGLPLTVPLDLFPLPAVVNTAIVELTRVFDCP